MVMTHHAKNSKVHVRLKRVHGHLAKVIEMLENESEHLEVAQQLQAVESAISSAKRTYIHDHIEHCLAGAQDSKKFAGRIEEFKEISKYL